MITDLGEEMFLNLPMKFFIDNKSKCVAVSPTCPNMVIANQFLLTTRAIEDAWALAMSYVQVSSQFGWSLNICSKSQDVHDDQHRHMLESHHAHCRPHITFWQGMCGYTPASICSGYKL
jgi:hypothetical protein